ncbi:hypothetical protein [uncultured Clostridium sp.]|uniref:hypothetical protein n=1 Tax=uncultured Clostridium sp. TaxID=59620 RepID=UPI002611116A|nr:hypothetical protein [uncultured Clostridium sp.]
MKYTVTSQNQKIEEKTGYIYNTSSINKILLLDEMGVFIPIYPGERFPFNIQDHESLYLKTWDKEKTVVVNVLSCSYSPGIRTTVAASIPQNSVSKLIKSQEVYVK